MIWILAFILTGLGAGLAARRLMPGAAPDRTLWPMALGVLGALTGGLSSLMLFGYGRAYDYLYGYTHVYETAGTTQPAQWVSIIFAPASAVLVLALHGLAGSRLPTR